LQNKEQRRWWKRISKNLHMVGHNFLLMAGNEAGRREERSMHWHQGMSRLRRGSAAKKAPNLLKATL